MIIYERERQLLHRQIIQKAIEGKKPSDEPHFVFLGGGMLTGKTGMRKILLGEALEYEKVGIPTHPSLVKAETVIIDPSLFAVLPEFEANSHVQHPEKLPNLVEEYYDISAAIVRVSLDRGFSILFPDHADNKLAISEIISSADPYSINKILVGMSMDPIKHILVTRDLESRGFGRRVNDEIALKWLLQFQQGWLEYISLFPNAVLFDSSSLLRVIAYAENYGSLTVSDLEKWEDFISINESYRELLIQGLPIADLIAQRDKNNAQIVSVQDIPDTRIPELKPDENNIWSLLSSEFIIWLYHESLRQRVKHKESKKS